MQVISSAIQTFTVDSNGDITAKGSSSITGDQTDYGEIYVTGNSTGQTTNAVADTFDKVTQFASNGSSRNCTNDATNNQITVTNAGKYIFHCEASFSGTNNATITLRASVNGTDQSNVESVRKLGTAGDVGSASLHGILDLSASDIVTLEVASDGTSSTFVLQSSNMSLSRL